MNDTEVLARYIIEARNTVHSARRLYTPGPVADHGGGAPADGLDAVVEELQVASEELRQQNEQLLRSQADLEHAHRRYASLFEFSPIGFIITDEHGVIHEMNQAAESLLSNPRDALRGKPIVLYVPERDRRMLRDHLSEAATGSRPQWQGFLATTRGFAPPTRVQFTVSAMASPIAAFVATSDRPPPAEYVWSITDLSRVAVLETQVRRLDDGMWLRVAEHTRHLQGKIDRLELDLREARERPGERPGELPHSSEPRP